MIAVSLEKYFMTIAIHSTKYLWVGGVSSKGPLTWKTFTCHDVIMDLIGNQIGHKIAGTALPQNTVLRS